MRWIPARNLNALGWSRVCTQDANCTTEELVADTDGWVIQEYPLYFEHASLIRCDDPAEEAEASARRMLLTQHQHRRRQLRAGGGSRGNMDEGEEEAMTVEVNCVGGYGCTFGQDALTMMSAAADNATNIDSVRVFG